ncbi:MAG TPA: hypothetical protein VII47_02175 [Actinomycetota bacterium]|jgi:hypothetical protein
MNELLALGLVPVVGTIFLYFSAWAEGSMLREAEAGVMHEAEQPES